MDQNSDVLNLKVGAQRGHQVRAARPRSRSGAPRRASESFTSSKPSTAFVLAALQQDETGGVRSGSRVSDSEGDLDRLGVDERGAAGQRNAADPRGGGEKESASWGNTAHRAGWCCWFSACSPGSAYNSFCAPAVTASMLLYM